MISGRFDKTPEWRVYSGEWDAEPDWLEFEHAGLPCLLLRGPSGAWSGYVHIPPYHPVLGEVHDDGHMYWPFDVHGGITWEGSRAFSDGRMLFMVGFDLHHLNDWAPEDHKYKDSMRGEYRNTEYAMQETRLLAEQVSGYKPLEQMANIFSGSSEANDDKA